MGIFLRSLRSQANNDSIWKTVSRGKTKKKELGQLTHRIELVLFFFFFFFYFTLKRLNKHVYCWSSKVSFLKRKQLYKRILTHARVLF
jgi:hypothetical protein